MPSNSIVAIIALTAILITAIIKDINGYLIYSIGSLIALLGGAALIRSKRK